MSDAQKKEGQPQRIDPLIQPVKDRKLDLNGNEIGGFEGQQVSGDSIRKKLIEQQGKDENE